MLLTKQAGATIDPFSPNYLAFTLLLIAFLLTSVPLLHGANTSWTEQVRGFIAQKQLTTAESMIVSRMMLHPQDPELITLLAEVRLDQKRFGEALRLLADANKLGGKTSLRANLTGLVEVAMDRLDLARPEFQLAIRLDPDNPMAHYFMARLLYTQNHFDEAIQQSMQTIALSPNFVRAYENVGLCYEGKQENQQAEHWYLEAISRENKAKMRTEWPLLDLGTLLIKENQISRAKPYLLQALALNPGNPHTVLEMGILLKRSEDLEGALRQFKEATVLDPGLANSYYLAARVYQKLGRKKEAEEEFSEFRRISESTHTAKTSTKPDKLAFRSGD